MCFSVPSWKSGGRRGTSQLPKWLQDMITFHTMNKNTPALPASSAASLKSLLLFFPHFPLTPFFLETYPHTDWIQLVSFIFFTFDTPRMFQSLVAFQPNTLIYYFQNFHWIQKDILELFSYSKRNSCFFYRTFPEFSSKNDSFKYKYFLCEGGSPQRADT